MSKMNKDSGLHKEITHLKNENRSLNTQIRDLIKAESELYTLQEGLDKQRKIYIALNEIMHTINALKKNKDIVAALVAFTVNVLQYERSIFLSATRLENDCYELKVLAFEGYYTKEGLDKIQGLGFTLPGEQIETLQNHPLHTQIKEGDFPGRYLDLDEYIGFPIKNIKSHVSGFLIAGNTNLRKEYYSAVDRKNVAYIALSNLTNHASSVLNNIESYKTIQNEQKLLAKANEELKRLDKIKMEFFSNISHEIRTPLTLSLGPLEELLKKDYFNKKDYHYLNIIHTNQLMLLKLITELLDFSKLESGEIKSCFKKKDIIKVLKMYISILEPAAKTKKIKISCNFPVSEIDVYIDENKFEKIIMNIFSNALKFTGIGGRISIALSEQPDKIKIAVGDTGIGIRESDHEKIFERFSQVDSSETRNYSGTGIGLALVKELLRIHGGTIDVSSRIGEGSTFNLWLPKGKEHLDPELITRGESNDQEVSHQYEKLGFELENPGEEQPIPETGNIEKKVVLVVDDNRDMRFYIASLLESRYHVRQAENGQRALEAARENIPDLIISDVMMPVMGGYELCRKIKLDKGPLSRIPVILVTAKVELSMKLKGLAYGADDYLVKPFSSIELFSRTSNLIKWRSQDITLARTLEELGKTHRQLEKNYKIIKLTRSRFAGISRRVGRAEIASDILHNWGNKLNSITVSVQLLDTLLTNLSEQDMSRLTNLLASSDESTIIKKKPLMINYLNEFDKKIKINGSKAMQEIAGLQVHMEAMRNFLQFLENDMEIMTQEETCSINDLLDEAIAMIDFEDYMKKNIEIRRNYSKLPTFYLDKHKLNQVFFELLRYVTTSCSESSKQKLCIILETKMTGHFLKIRIKDNGLGMEKAKADHIFKMDSQALNIGLHISANHIELLNGKIKCIAEGLEMGTTMEITLPWSRKSAVQ